MKKQHGSTLVLVMTFSLVFLTILGGVVSLIIGQYKTSQKRAAWDLSLNIAEAGIDYYKWHLAHNPEDFCDGNIAGSSGCQTIPYGPFEHEYKDPEGNVIGKFAIKITPSTSCCSPVTLESKGWTTTFSSTTRTVRYYFGRKNLAQYTMLTDGNVWLGPNAEIKGSFHANGGIRMDAQQNAIVSSAKETYICGEDSGCTRFTCEDPCLWTDAGCECPGIWGSGNGQGNGLWNFPVSNIDFDLIRRDLSVLKTTAQQEGYYYQVSDAYGYHVLFSGDSFSVYKVTGLTDAVRGWNGTEWVEESNDFDQEILLETHSLGTDCVPIFIEDNVWVNGTINGRASVIAAKLPESQSTMKKIIIHDNINSSGQESMLSLISQKDILLPLYIPSSMQINAALIAQSGRFYRYNYAASSNEPYRTYAMRSSLHIEGSVISRGMMSLNWANNKGKLVSGFNNVNIAFNQNYITDPPPYFPTYGDYETSRWEEK